MKDITVILPLHEFSEDIDVLVGRALNSYYDTDPKFETTLMVVGPAKVLEDFRDSRKFPAELNVTFVENEESDFCNQINAGATACQTKYFSILEFDDEYTHHYFENVEKYFSLHADYSIIIPINEIHDFQQPEAGAMGYLNEAFWASSFSEKIGFPDEESLMDYLSANVTGAVFNTADFLELGKLKPSIKIAFWHEFLLRALHKDKVIFVMPKVGYKHYINRENSLANIYNKTISEKEAQWWVSLAQEEYYYKNDRKKTYDE